MDDAALVQQAADGDRDAFGALYDRYAGRLHAFFWWVLRDGELANEAVYETFLEAGSRIGDLREPARLRSWLFAIAGHEALRYRSPRKGDAGPLAPPTGDPAWDGLVARLGDVIAGLTPKERILLDLRYQQGLDGAELAGALGVKPEDATAVVGDLGQRVEREIGATAVAYFGTERCPELAESIGTVAGPLDARTREKAAAHADTCPTCAQLRRRRIGPQALIALSPAPAPAATAKAQVLEDVELGEHSGRDWPARRLGFPPPLMGGPGRRWRFAVAAALVVALGTGILLLNRTGRSTDVAAVGTTVAPSSTSSTRPTSSTSTTTTTSVPPDEVGGPNAAATATDGTAGTATGRTGTRAGGTGAGGGGGGGSGGGGGGGGGEGGGGSGGGGTPSEDTTVPTEPPSGGGGGGGGNPAPPAAANPPDQTGPSLSTPSVTVTCTGAGGATVTVTVKANDTSGVASVVAYVNGRPATMAGSGDLYSVSVDLGGPLPPQIIVTVLATDTRDNVSNATRTVQPGC